MVGTCANPAYSARFHTLQRGKLFEVETTPDTELVAPAGKLPKFPPISRRIHSLWPCGASVGNLRVIYDRRNGICVEPLPMVAGVASLAAVNDAGNNLKRQHDRTSAKEILSCTKEHFIRPRPNGWLPIRSRAISGAIVDRMATCAREYTA